MGPSDWKAEFSARRVVILAESETARAAILAGHDSAESARAELEALDDYTAGRLSGARSVAIRRLFDDTAPGRSLNTDAFREELEARRSAIFSEQRRAGKAIYAKHDSVESAHPEVIALLAYNRGRLAAARDNIAMKHGLPTRRALRQRVYEARVQLAAGRPTAMRSAISAMAKLRPSAR